MKKIILITSLLLSSLFANDFFSFKDTLITSFKKEGSFYFFNARDYLNNKNLTTCILSSQDNNITAIYCQPVDKINAVGSDEIRGQVKDNKIIIFTPLVEIQELSIKTN